MHETTDIFTYDRPYELAQPGLISHFQFKGWYFDLSDETSKLENGVSWNFAENKTVYAKFEEDEKVVITFKQEGQPDIIKSIYVGESLPASEIPTPVQEPGYDIVWQDKDYNNIRENLIINAVKIPKTYTITYDVDGDMLDEFEESVTFGKPVRLCYPNDREQYDFAGWYTEDGTKIENGNVWNIPSDTTLYARWEEKQQVTVTFVQQGKPDIIKTVYVNSALVDIPTPVAVEGHSVVWETVDFSEINEDMTVNAIITAETYNVKFDMNGIGEQIQDASVTFGQEYTLPTPTNDLYSFVRWTYNGRELEQSTVLEFDLGSHGDTITLVAEWENKKVTITFVQEGQDNIVKTINKGATLEDIPTPVEVEGYDVSWSVTNFANIMENVEVTVVKTGKNYTVTYDVDGDVLDNTTTNAKYGDACELATPATKENYTFLGWFTEDGTEIVSGAVWNIANDTTLYARWEENEKVSVTFKQEEQSDIVKTIYKGEALVDIPTPVAVEGHSVVWETVDFSEINEDMTVNAIITAETYNVKFDMNGIGEQIQDASVTFGQEYTLPTPTNDLYSFVRWTYNGRELEQSTVLEFDLGSHGDTITLVAEWENKKVTITFVQEGQDNIVKTINKGATLEDIPTPVEVEGYDVSWSVTNFANIMENVEVTVVKTGKNYTVTYSLADDESIDGEIQETFKFGDSYALKTPTKENYEFAGWMNGEEVFALSGTWNVAQDVVLIATWTKVAVTVTYDIGDTDFYGSSTIAGFPEESVISVTIGEEIVLPNLTIDYSADKAFGGWKIQGTSTTLKGGESYVVEENVSFIATWYTCWTPNY